MICEEIQPDKVPDPTNTDIDHKQRWLLFWVERNRRGFTELKTDEYGRVSFQRKLSGVAAHVRLSVSHMKGEKWKLL